MAVRAAIARIAEIDSAWRDANVVARSVKTNAPPMPLTDWELMSGARQRALAVRQTLIGQKLEADLYVGLEGGFHSISLEGQWHTFLRGWAFVTDGQRGSFGMSPSIGVPPALVKSVIEGKREGAGRTIFVKGGYTKRRGKDLPTEEWKLPFYTQLHRHLPGHVVGFFTYVAVHADHPRAKLRRDGNVAIGIGQLAEFRHLEFAAAGATPRDSQRNTSLIFQS